MPIKSLKKINLNKKTEGIHLLDKTNWYWGQQLFCYLICSLYIDSKFHIFTVGAQSKAHVCQNFENCRRNSPQKTQKAAVFLFERTWAEND
jgi:hypothetical protein